MAVTAYTGRPGAGKSYAMVEQVIIPAVMDGRRVLTNIEGVDAEKVEAYAIMQGTDPDEVGQLVVFDGQQSLQPNFWPTEASGDENTFVKGGDLIVFDEWRLYYPNTGKMPTEDLEPFLRWHRHLTDKDGQSCDVVIGTQLITDIHRNFRGLIHRSYKFKKLDAVGASKAFAWHVYEGHLQPKGEFYSVGNGRYRKEIFALYNSYASGKGKESSTDKRGGFFTKGFIGVGVLAAILIAFGLKVALEFLSGGSAKAEKHEQVPPAQRPAAVTSLPPQAVGWRIAGTVHGEYGIRVVLHGPNGVVRYVGPDGFRFSEDGRAMSGVFEGRIVTAEDRFESAREVPAAVVGVMP